MKDERVHPERLVVGDAFGQVLQACQAAEGAPGAAFGLIERSDGHLGVMDAARYFAPADEWSPTTAFARERAAGRVLDIGAGAGRVALALQDHGRGVVALDISPGATTVCQQRGVHSTFTGDVFDLAATAPAPFDTFLMLGNNLGLVGGPDQAPRFLEALAGMARPGARVIGETLDPYGTSDPDHLRYHEENRRLGRLAGQLRLRVRHRRLATPWWDYLCCTPEELQSILSATRWELSDVYSAAPSHRREPAPWPSGQWTAVLTLRR
ncbi:MAG: class I SAM-dependent methyltransferase [Actinobacteria bacterium]|nr:class I SAM-dependent methyltransferase [Actinomycetota bacterium]